MKVIVVVDFVNQFVIDPKFAKILLERGIIEVFSTTNVNGETIEYYRLKK